MSGTFHCDLRRPCVLALVTLALVAAPATAADLTDRLLDDSRDGRLDGMDFVSAALIAGGTDDECELSGWLDEYLHRRDALLESLPSVWLPDASPLAQLKAIHNALHEQLLTGQYDAAASDLRLTLTNGDFNCLSSLVMFVDLCDAAGIPVEIWLARGHVFLQAHWSAESIVIEPGTPEWNGRAMVRRRALTVKNTARRITPIELLGKFYYNRGVERLKDRQFAEGIELLETSLQLDPLDRDARANLVAGLNNWAVDHLQADRYGAAAILIEQGLSLDPAFAPLIANGQLVRAKLTK